MLQVLLAHKAGVNLAKADGSTPVFIASQAGHTEVLPVLPHLPVVRHTLRCLWRCSTSSQRARSPRQSLSSHALYTPVVDIVRSA